MKKSIDTVAVYLENASLIPQEANVWYFLALAFIHIFAELVDVMWKIYNKGE